VPGEAGAEVAVEKEGELWILVHPVIAVFILINQLKNSS